MPDISPGATQSPSAPYYITTAIAYPNGAPHVGHAYEYIATDAIARFKRLDGFDVRFLTGTDVHGLKMARRRRKEGIPTAELARRNSDVFQAMQEKLDISFDRFIRTTDADHYEASKEIWNRMNDAGDIYLDTYSGWYSVRDERFFTEDETSRSAPTASGRHRDRHPGDVDRGADLLLPAVGLHRPAAGALRRAPGVHRARRAAQRGRQLRLRRAARPVDLADHVRLGRPGARPSRPRHVRVGGRADELPDRRRLPRHRLRVVPQVLAGRSAHDRQGHHPVPHRVLAGVPDVGRDRAAAQGVRARLPLLNGREDEQVGRQRRRPGRLWSTSSASTQVRYFLLREVPFGQDGSYSEEAIIGRINADLANELGNLAQRSLSMVAKNLDGVVPEPGEFTDDDRALLALADGLLDRGPRPLRRARHAPGAGGDLVGARRGQPVLLGAGAVGAAQDRRREDRRGSARCCTRRWRWCASPRCWASR